MLTADGVMYAMGSNENLKLGVGRTYDDLTFANAPIRIDAIVNVG